MDTHLKHCQCYWGTIVTKSSQHFYKVSFLCVLKYMRVDHMNAVPMEGSQQRVQNHMLRTGVTGGCECWKPNPGP